MPFDFLYRDLRTQNKHARLYSLIVKDARISESMLSPDGETYEYSKQPVDFRCGIYEGAKTYGISLTDGLTVTDGSLVLISTDVKAEKIKRGDKIVFDGEEYSVTDTNDVANPKRNTEYQRRINNKIKVIALT